MRLLLARLRGLIWPAVIAAVLGPLAIIIALVSPGSIALVIALGSTAVTMATLANRA
jgi:hypothetical protein